MTVLPAPVRATDWRSVDSDSLEAAVTLLAETHDYVILDTPAIFNDIVATALELATVVLVVITPDVECLRDTLLAMDYLRSRGYPEEKEKLVVSAIHLERGAFMGVGGAADVRHDELARLLGKDVFWIIPYDRGTHETAIPVVTQNPGTEAAKSLTRLARALA